MMPETGIHRDKINMINDLPDRINPTITARPTIMPLLASLMMVLTQMVGRDPSEK